MTRRVDDARAERERLRLGRGADPREQLECMLERGVPLRDETVDQRSLRSSAAAAGCPSAALGVSDTLNNFRGWLLPTILTSAYIISRGIAKAGERDPNPEQQRQSRMQGGYADAPMTREGSLQR